MLGPLQAAFVTSPDLSQLESLSAEQRLELIKTNRDVLLRGLHLVSFPRCFALDTFCIYMYIYGARYNMVLSFFSGNWLSKEICWNPGSLSQDNRHLHGAGSSENFACRRFGTLHRHEIQGPEICGTDYDNNFMFWYRLPILHMGLPVIYSRRK